MVSWVRVPDRNRRIGNWFYLSPSPKFTYKGLAFLLAIKVPQPFICFSGAHCCYETLSMWLRVYVDVYVGVETRQSNPQEVKWNTWVLTATTGGHPLKLTKRVLLKTAMGGTAGAPAQNPNFIRTQPPLAETIALGLSLYCAICHLCPLSPPNCGRGEKLTWVNISKIWPGYTM